MKSSFAITFRDNVLLNLNSGADRRAAYLAGTSRVNDLRNPPSNHLKKLDGDRAGQYSLRINDQWRICFVWDGRDAHDVEITDYH